MIFWEHFDYRGNNEKVYWFIWSLLHIFYVIAMISYLIHSNFSSFRLFYLCVSLQNDSLIFSNHRYLCSLFLSFDFSIVCPVVLHYRNFFVLSSASSLICSLIYSRLWSIHRYSAISDYWHSFVGAAQSTWWDLKESNQHRNQHEAYSHKLHPNPLHTFRPTPIV